MKKIFILAFIIVLLSCGQGKTCYSSEKLHSNNGGKTQLIQLQEEYKESVAELIAAMDRQQGIFMGGFSFTELMELLTYQFNGFAYQDIEAAECLADMTETYAKIDLVFKKWEIDLNNKDINNMRKEIECIKTFIKIVQNDRKVMIECNQTKSGKKLIDYKKKDSLYKRLKQYLNSMK